MTSDLELDLDLDPSNYGNLFFEVTGGKIENIEVIFGENHDVLRKE